MTLVQQMISELEKREGELEEAIRKATQELQAELDEVRGALHGLRGGTPRRTSGTASGRAPRGANKSAVLDFLKENPNSTAKQISDGTGVASPTVHNLLTNMSKSGDIKGTGSPKKYKLG